MSDKTYYHNPRCSKSRQGLELLKNKKVDFQVKEYLKEGLTEKELINIFNLLKSRPVRNKETIYKELELNKQKLDDVQMAKIIVKNPILLERPILVTASAAAVGRPPEELLTIL